jgi:ligand-binding sensor domain-containing protein
VNGKSSRLDRRSRRCLCVACFHQRGVGYYDEKGITPCAPTGARLFVRDIAETQDKRLLTATTLAAVLVDELRGAEQLTGEAPLDTFSVLQDPRGRIWVGTAEQGIFIIDHGQITRFDRPGITDSIIKSLALDHSGNLWIASVNGVHCLTPDLEPLPLPEMTASPTVLFVDSQGVVWVGSYGGGISRFHDGRFTSFRSNQGLAADQVLSMAETPDGSLWVGTADGLTQLSDIKFPTFSQSEGLASPGALSVSMAPDGALWVGTTQGVSRYKDGVFQNLGVNRADGLGSRWVKQTYPMRNGDVYFVGARKNIDYYSDGKIRWSKRFEAWPRSMVEDEEGPVVAFAGSVMRLVDGDPQPYLLKDGTPLRLGWINYMLIARDGTLWIAEEEGIYYVRDGVLTDCFAQTGTPRARYHYLVEDDRGVVWAAQKGGILRCHKDGFAS